MRPFLLLRPKVLSLRNTWFGKTDEPLARGVRIGTLITTLVFVPYLIFLGIQESIIELDATPGAFRSLVELFNLAFITILFFSSCIHSLNSMFLAKDLELLLAAPVPAWRFFTGKFTETAISSGWVLVAFYIPAMLGLGYAFDVAPLFYILSVLYCIPLVAVPTGLSMVAAILFVRVYPARRVREALVIASLFVIVGLHFTLQGPELVATSLEADIADAVDSTLAPIKFRSLTVDSIANLSRPFELAAAGKTAKTIEALFGALIIAVLCVLGAYRCFADLHLKVVSIDTLTAPRRGKKRRPFPLRSLLPFRGALRAFMAKDYLIFLRDLAQPVQLIVFTGMSIVAIVGFKMTGNAGATFQERFQWWNEFTLSGVIAFHTVIAVLFAGRFTYPSISIEGDSMWAIKSAPLPAKTFLTTKIFVATIPTVCVLTPLLWASCILVHLPPMYTAFALAIGVLNMIAATAIAISLGAYFGNFRYEHLGQVNAGLGSLITMLVSIVIIPLDLGIALGLTGALHLAFTGLSESALLTILALTLGLIHATCVEHLLNRGKERWLRA